MMVDLIVALGGGDDRKQAAILLYKQGYGHNILFTGEQNLPQLYKQWGIGIEGIYTNFISTDTITDVVQIRDAMLQNKYLSAIIVDSAYHLPRTKMLMSRTFCYGASVTYSSVATKVNWKQELGELAAYIREYITVRPQC